MMPYKSHKLPNDTFIVKMVLLYKTKLKNIIVTINYISILIDIFKILLGPLGMCFHYNDNNVIIF
jgi:hypothetical protein